MPEKIIIHLKQLYTWKIKKSHDLYKMYDCLAQNGIQSNIYNGQCHVYYIFTQILKHTNTTRRNLL